VTAPDRPPSPQWRSAEGFVIESGLEAGVSIQSNQVRRPNSLLRRARLSRPSPYSPVQPMSRSELAEAVNAHVFHATGRVTTMNGHYVGRLERGHRRWPMAAYRAAFRAVLGVETDAELGFYCKPWDSDTSGRRPDLEAGCACAISAQPLITDAIAMQFVVVGPGLAVVLGAVSSVILPAPLPDHSVAPGRSLPPQPRQPAVTVHRATTCIPALGDGHEYVCPSHARSAIRVAHTDRALRAGRGLVGAAGQPGDDLGDPGWGWGRAVRLGAGRFELRRPSSSAVVDLASFARRGSVRSGRPKRQGKEASLLATLNVQRTGGLAARPGSCSRIVGRTKNGRRLGGTTCVCCCRRTGDAATDRWWDWRCGCGRWAWRCGCARRPTGQGEGSER